MANLFSSKGCEIRKDEVLSCVNDKCQALGVRNRYEATKGSFYIKSDDFNVGIYPRPESLKEMAFGVKIDGNNYLVDHVYVDGPKGIPRDYRRLPRFEETVRRVCDEFNIKRTDYPYTLNDISLSVSHKDYNFSKDFLKNLGDAIDRVGSAHYEIWYVYEALCREEDDRQKDMRADARAERNRVLFEYV
jgi:hypothetical protein